MAGEPVVPEGGAVASEVVAPVETPVVAPAVAETAPEAAPVAETPAVEAAAEPAAEPTEAAEPVADAKVEAKPDAKPEGEAAPTEQPTAPVYTDFTMPEGVEAAPEQIKQFTDLLGAVDVRTQEGAQALLDLHTSALKTAQDARDQRQHDVFAETQREWVKQFDKQAGNRRDTILNSAKSLINDSITDKKERAELWSVLAFTGAGNHPAVINALAKINKRVTERAAPPSPLPNNGARAGSPADRRYGAAPKRQP